MLGIGRVVYGFAIIGLGVVSLGYLEFVHQLQPVPTALSGYKVFAVLIGLMLVVAGAAVMTNAMVRRAAMALVVMFAVGIIVLQIPSAFIDPGLLRSPWWVRTFESLALAGGAMILAEWSAPATRDSRIRTGRILFGISLPVFGVLHFVYAENVASLVPPWYPGPLFWAYLTGIGHFAAGVAIAAGVVPRLAATLAGVMYGSWALTLHIPRSWCRAFGPCEFMPEVVGLQGSRPGLTSLFIAFGMWGSAWIVAGSLAKRREVATEIDGEVEAEPIEVGA